MLNTNVSLKKSSLYLCFLVFSLFAYTQVENDYFRFVDSADIHIDYNSEKALSFLEAIPKPIEENIPGRVADYYSLKALIYDDYNEYTSYHQCVILAIKYAEKENNFCVAGEACVALFSNLYYTKQDVSAYKYLDKAREYYAKCDNEYGHIEVTEVEAYAKFLDGDYEACNNLLLNELETYKSINEDLYYYMFALYMLSSNYIYLDDFENAHKYFNEFKKLKDNSNIVKYNYLSFEAGINSCFADVFFTRKQIDSSLNYLKSSAQLKTYMGEDVLEDYYRLFADIHEQLGDVETSKVYIDSLLLIQNEILEKTVNASFDLNDSLIKTESELMIQNKKNTFNSVLSVCLIFFLLLLSVFSFLYFRKEKQTLETYGKQKSNNLSYLQSNNNQLALKVHGLEAYIKKLKLEVKQISRTEGIGNQKEKIKDLYKNLHINSSTLLDKSENHLEIVNELNIEFFNQLEGNCPQLNKSEIIICYYIFMGFTNKEIAIFLNTTIRSVESRRYRISKKINFNKKKTTLLKYLQNTFSETLKHNHLD